MRARQRGGPSCCSAAAVICLLLFLLLPHEELLAVASELEVVLNSVYFRGSVLESLKRRSKFSTVPAAAVIWEGKAELQAVVGRRKPRVAVLSASESHHGGKSRN